MVPRSGDQGHGRADVAHAAGGPRASHLPAASVGEYHPRPAEDFRPCRARGSRAPFAVRVKELIEDNATLGAIVGPLLSAWQALREQIAVLDRQVLARAKSDPVARRLMS